MSRIILYDPFIVAPICSNAIIGYQNIFMTLFARNKSIMAEFQAFQAIVENFIQEDVKKFPISSMQTRAAMICTVPHRAIQNQKALRKQKLQICCIQSKAFNFLLNCFSKARQQVYPPRPEDEAPQTRLQERLLKKLGKNAYPFKFQVCSPSESLLL